MLGAFSMGWLFLIIAAIVMASGTIVLCVMLCRWRGNGNNQPQEQNFLAEAEHVRNDSRNPIIANELSNENRNDEMNQNQESHGSLMENARESENNLTPVAELSSRNNIILNAGRNINLKAGEDLVSALKKFVLKKRFRDFKLRIKDKIIQDTQSKFDRALRKIMLKEYFRSFNLRVRKKIAGDEQEANQSVIVILKDAVMKLRDFAKLLNEFYEIKDPDKACDELHNKLVGIDSKLSDIWQSVEEIRKLIPKTRDFEPMFCFLDVLKHTVYSKQWVNIIEKNFDEYLGECYVMGNCLINSNPTIKRDNFGEELQMWIETTFGEDMTFDKLIEEYNNNQKFKEENAAKILELTNKIIELQEKNEISKEKNQLLENKQSNLELNFEEYAKENKKKFKQVNEKNNETDRRLESIEEQLEEYKNTIKEEIDNLKKENLERKNEIQYLDRKIDKSTQDLLRKIDATFAEIHAKINSIDEKSKERDEKAEKEAKERDERVEKEAKERDERAKKELEEIKQKNKERNEKVDKEFEEYKKQNQKEIDEMKQKTAELYAKLFERAEKGEKSANELYEKIHNLSHQVSSISSQHSSRNLSRHESFRIFGNAPRGSQIRNELYDSDDNFGSDQETPGNNQNANFGFKNANDNININLNANQKENEKNDAKKSLIDRIKKVKNKKEDKKENVPKLDKEKDFEEDKKEDEKK